MEDSTTDSDSVSQQANARWFGPTHWSVVLQAGTPESTHADAARARLCQAYWYPIYFYVRRLGHSQEEAQDLTQEFFARMLQKNYFQTADPLKGKFRSFLLLMLKRFMANEWDRANRQKRGGGQEVLSLDAQDTENRYLAEPADTLSPDKAFERRWAVTLMAQVFQRLQQECAAAGKGELFEELRPFLQGENEETYDALSRRLQMPRATLKVLVHRYRQRYGQLLREQIAPTVSRPEEIEDEIRDLFAALS